MQLNFNGVALAKIHQTANPKNPTKERQSIRWNVEQKRQNVTSNSSVNATPTPTKTNSNLQVSGMDLL